MAGTKVVYGTMTRHSKKLAEAVGEALGMKAENIKDNPVINDADLLFIISGIYGGVSMPELLSYAEGLDANSVKSAVIVTSCASGVQKQIQLRSILESKKINVIDEFVCKGAFLFASFGHPNAKDIQDVTDFARRITSTM